jgi:hypothetical protein
MGPLTIGLIKQCKRRQLVLDKWKQDLPNDFLNKLFCYMPAYTSWPMNNQWAFSRTCNMLMGLRRSFWDMVLYSHLWIRPEGHHSKRASILSGSIPCLKCSTKCCTMRILLLTSGELSRSIIGVLISSFLWNSYDKGETHWILLGWCPIFHIENLG